MASLLNAIDGLFGEVPSGMTPAAQPFSDPADSVNQPSGSDVASARWPGAVDPTPYTDAGPGPQNGLPGDAQYGAETFAEQLPAVPTGGGVQDTAALSGHDAPSVPWDSSAGAPFAPSGALDPSLHGTDTGGVARREFVVPAEIGTLTRHTGIGQTNNREAATQTAIGQTAPNDRSNMDQVQNWDPDGHDPWEIPYAERPIYNNVAYEAMPVEETGSIYTPAGALPDRSNYFGAAESYNNPPDPDISTPSAAPVAAPSNDYGWVLG